MKAQIMHYAIIAFKKLYMNADNQVGIPVVARIKFFLRPRK